MSKLIFKYGNGKTTDLCQTDYNFREQGAKTAVMNADNNNQIISKFEETGKNLLIRNVDLEFDNNMIFEKIIRLKEQGVSNLFIDNIHFLNEKQIFELFMASKALDIEIQCYGDRLYNGKIMESSIRTMSLADDIEKINGIINNSHKSRLQFYHGAMNSSKSTKLLIKARELEVKGLKVYTIKHVFDRTEYEIKSRIGISRKADYVVNDERLYGLGNYLYDQHVNCIFVDECQFLTEKQIEDLYNINRDFNIPIECYGLRTDFTTNTFTGSRKLLAIADDLIKAKTICSCKNHPEAIFNARVDKFGNFVTEGEQIVVDQGNYVSICPNCYINNVMNLDLKDTKKLIKKLTLK